MAHHFLNIIAILALTSLHHTLSSSQKIKLIHSHSIKQGEGLIPMVPEYGGVYMLANISVGTPPVPQLLAMDTGSYLIWTRCNCPTCFDPAKSTTYKEVPGDQPPCSDFDYGPVKTSPCTFEQKYLDGSYTKGILALERYTFGNGTQISEAVFGCANDTSPPDMEGVMGMIPGTRFHFLAQTGTKFSFCVGNVTNPRYEFNQLVLGADAVMDGPKTPLKFIQFYTVSLIGISVGDVSLRTEVQDIIIDSGATYSRLKKSLFGPLAEQILVLARAFFLERVEVEDEEENICFGGDLAAKLKGFPLVILHLEGGVDVELEVESLFKRADYGKAFCMTIVEGSNYNVLGITAMQYYNLGFDITAATLSLQKIDCEFLVD